MRKIFLAVRPNLLTILVFASFLAPYLLSTLPRLSLPGLSSEEAEAALPVIGDSPGVEYLPLGPLKLPLNRQSYQGPMESYLSLPYTLVFGRTPEALRLCTIFFGAATLVLAYLFCLEYFIDKRIAWACAFLAGTAPAFISGTRSGMYYASILLFFETAGALCLLRWRRQERAAYLYSAAFLFGVGMACQSSFGIFMAALGITAALAFAPSLRRLAARPGAAFGRAFFCLFLFLVGALPMTLHVLLHTDRLRAVHVDHDVHLSDYSDNLKVRARELVDLWGGDPFTCEAFATTECLQGKKIGSSPTAPELPHWIVEDHGWIWLALPLASLLWLTLSALFSRRTPSRDRNLGLALFALAYWICSPVTIGSFRPDHVFPGLLPLLACVAAALVDIVERSTATWWASAKTALIVFSAVALRALDTSTLQARLSTMTGAAPYFSDAVYPLGRWLAANVHEPLLVDFGLDNTLAFLAKDSQPIMWVVGDGNERGVDWTGARSVRFYAAYMPGENRRAMQQGSRYAVEELGKKATLVQEFRNRDGRPVVGVYWVPEGLGNVRALLLPRRKPARNLPEQRELLDR